jgi:hypothetical protein
MNGHPTTVLLDDDDKRGGRDPPDDSCDVSGVRAPGVGASDPSSCSPPAKGHAEGTGSLKNRRKSADMGPGEWEAARKASQSRERSAGCHHL